MKKIYEIFEYKFSNNYKILILNKERLIFD